MLRQNANADLPGCDAISEGENDRSLTNVGHQNPTAQPGITCQTECQLIQMYDCQRGECGICQVAVIEGVPDHRDHILSDEEQAENKVMQICVSRAKTPRLVLDL